MASETSPAPTGQQQQHGLSISGGSSSEQDASLSPLEQEVLDEYARLLGNMNSLSDLLASVSSSPSAEILDALRGLERKTSLVFTLLKASVYSIVLQQQIFGDEGEGGAASQAG